MSKVTTARQLELEDPGFFVVTQGNDRGHRFMINSLGHARWLAEELATQTGKPALPVDKRREHFSPV